MSMPAGAGRIPVVTVRYWAAARDLAGRRDESISAGTLEDALRSLADSHGPAMARILAACTYYLNGEAIEVRDHAKGAQGVTPRTPRLSDGDVIEALPPFAGG